MSDYSTIPVYIEEKPVGDSHPIYSMADFGLTNDGDLQRAFDLSILLTS